MLAWTESLSVGEPTLDGHHQHLFDLLAQIARMGGETISVDAVKALFDDLHGYMAYHFSEEEAVMERVGFPFLELHKVSHQTIAMRVEDLAASLSAANAEQVAGELYDFLTGWLVHHIEIEDFEYRPYLGNGTE